MNHPPLKRHESLQPFSRDHYAGLVQARRMRVAADGAAQERLASLTEFMREWDSLLREHLTDEEHLLLNLIGDALVANRLLNEHDQLRQFATQASHFVERLDPPDADWLRALATLLHDHIRWEERTLFPLIEQQSPPAVLVEMSRHTEAIEDSRPRWERAENTTDSARSSQAKEPA